MCILLSLGERLTIKPGFIQFGASRSSPQFGIPVVFRSQPPFLFLYSSYNKYADIALKKLINIAICEIYCSLSWFLACNPI